LLATETPAQFSEAVAAAAAALAAGEPVALPTETVYGLAADALRPDAVVKIFEAKERPFFDPLIVHLPSRDWLERVAIIPAESRALVERLLAKFWPGPLTLVLPRQSIVPDIVTSGLETVAVRMSAHPMFRAVIERFGKPLAAPSANRFGRISPTAAAHVRSELAGRIPLIVDGGATEHGLESTIVKVDGVRLTILRAGPVTPEELGVRNAECGTPSGLQPEAPGQLASHYAPRTRLRLSGRVGVPPAQRGILPRNTEDPRQDAEGGGRDAHPTRIGLLAWNDPAPSSQYAAVEILSPTGDLREAAATLFAKMRRLDEAGLDLILAEPVPEHGLGIAIMDRLRKAAAPHA
jgi:L-threonylcarbamoyladenylate synthase